MKKFLEGEDGYLFLANDTNQVLRQTTGEYEFSDDLARRLRTCHAVRKFLCSRHGAIYRHVVIPNKETVYSAKLPKSVGYQSCGLTPINRYFDVLPDAKELSYYDPAALAARAGEVDSFPRTDTHWTMYGALRYLRSALAHFSDTEKLFELDALDLVSLDPMPQTGDLAVHAGWPPELMPTLWPRTPTATLRFESPAPNFGYVRHCTNARPPRGHQRAVILHDSFIGWMLPYLMEIYAELILLLCPDFDPVAIEALQPDVVWFFQCERFFVRCPSNELDLLPWIAEKEREAATSLSGADYLAGLLPASDRA
jgi:alginate O-acetyltransferase complex protein AlgJ